MKIKWLGHSCFLLTSAGGVRVLIDPYDEDLGYHVLSLEAEIVTTSHNHMDHNYIKAVKGKFTHVKQAGKTEIQGIAIKGVPTFHDEAGGAQRGKNIVFLYAIDGLNICHCGDLGHMLTPEQAADIGAVDIMMVPVGGKYTIDYRGASEVARLLKPALIIPMHFKTPKLKLGVDGVDPFLEEMGGGTRPGKREIEVTRKNILSLAGVIVLDYE